PGGGTPRDALEPGAGLLVPALDALGVRPPEPAEPADDAGRARADDPVHGGGQERVLELEVPETPAEVDVVRVPRAPARDDRDLVEPVGPPAALAPPDLDLQRLPPSSALGATGPEGTKKPRQAFASPGYWKPSPS